MRAARLFAAVIGLGLVLAGAGSVRHESAAVPGDRGTFGMADALAFEEFPLFDAGDRVDGLPLTAVLRRDDTADFVSFVYGDCTPRHDAGCAPPIEIQVWPACRRNLALYSGRPGIPEPGRTTARGVPAASFEGGDRLELQSGVSTIVVFASSAARLGRVVGALRPLGSAFSGGPFPAPAKGALEGTLLCRP